MKIRTGFVSNSSTSSFCVLGVAFESVGAIAVALGVKGEPPKINGCGHKFDRTAMKFCPECGSKAFEEKFGRVTWQTQQIKEALHQHGLELRNYTDDGYNVYVGDTMSGKGQVLVDKVNNVNQKCLELFGMEAEIHSGEYAC